MHISPDCQCLTLRAERRTHSIIDSHGVVDALERFLLARGERVVRVAPRLMAGARKSSRERGKSYPIGAVAIARAAIREGLDALPVAQLAGAELDVRLLVDQRRPRGANREAILTVVGERAGVTAAD